MLNKNWKLLLAIYLLALVVHAGLYMKLGANPSSDYLTVYQPEAIKLANWLKGTAAFPEISTYQMSHLAYVSIITLLYLIFGENNLQALILLQIILAVLIFPLLLKITLEHYRSRTIAVLFVVLAAIYFDNVQWPFYAVPDSIYRVLFVFAYYFLMEYYFRQEYKKYFIFLTISGILLTFMRLETPLLFVPVIWLGLKIINERVKAHKTRKYIFYSVIIIVSILLLTLIKKIIVIAGYWYMNGWVLPGTDYHIPGLTQIEPFDYEKINSLTYLLGRQIKLFWLRFYQFINILPSFWSPWHRYYYGLHMSLFYVLAIFGALKAWKTKDEYFKIFAYLYLCSLTIHVLTFVDAARRQMYSVIPFFIIFRSE
ncbi:MAG: hypothetical protein PHV60_09460, partial [bacterium]|nr:hypothetical protein [bacterium]